MPTVEELEGQKRVLEERKLGLQKYYTEIRRISGEISYVTYRQNSGMGSHAGNIKTKGNLQKELEAKIAGLKRDYQLVPHLIPRQISRYDGEISRITVQVAKMGKQEVVQASPPEFGGLSSGVWRRRASPKQGRGAVQFFRTAFGDGTAVPCTAAGAQP